MNIDTGMIGLILAICAIILHFAARTSKKESDVVLIKSVIERQIETGEKLLEQTTQLLKRVEEKFSTSQHLSSELPIVVTRQWEFLEKTFHNRFEKHSISRRIVSKHIEKNANILLDSGSTIDLVTFELIESEMKNINVISNNIYAAMHLIGQKQIEFTLLPGTFNDRFAATYSDEANSLISNQSFNYIIIAATAIRFDTGIMVHLNDNSNLDFKKAALNKFQRSRNTKLIIAVDGTKLFEDTSKHQGVMDENTWKEIISKEYSRIFVVTSSLRPSVTSGLVNKYNEELGKFRQIGVTIDVDGDATCS